MSFFRKSTLAHSANLQLTHLTWSRMHGKTEVCCKSGCTTTEIYTTFEPIKFILQRESEPRRSNVACLESTSSLMGRVFSTAGERNDGRFPHFNIWSTMFLILSWYEKTVKIVWLQTYLRLLCYRLVSEKVVNVRIIRAPGGGHRKVNPHWLKDIRQWNLSKWAVKTDGLIYEMNILIINQFTQVEEPTFSLPHH